MRNIRELIDGDDDYTWSFPPWPYYHIDVYPRTIEAQNQLLEIIGEADEN